MGAAEKLQKRFGANLNESLGVRDTTVGGPAIAPQTIPAASPDEGRSRAREAGHMEVDRIVPDPNQPRKEFGEEAIERLAESLKKHGQLLPLRVRWNQDLGKWVIVTGERRYQAAKRAGLKTLSCVFIDRELTEAEILQEQLIENLLREDLRPIEQAKAYKLLMEMNSWKASDLAEALHVSKSAVSKALALLSLPGDVQEQVDRGAIPATAAYEVAKLPTDEDKREMAERVVGESMSREEAVEAIREKVEETREREGAEKPASARRTRGPKVKTYRVEGAKVVVTFEKKTVRAGDPVTALEQALEQARAEAEPKARKVAA